MSSESITLADFKTRRARNVISSRFPIGVPTRYKPGLSRPRFGDSSGTESVNCGEDWELEQKARARIFLWKTESDRKVVDGV